MSLSEGLELIFEREQFILSDGRVHPLFHGNWYESAIYPLKTYKYVSVEKAEEWRSALEEEQIAWWQHPAVYTTPQVCAEMQRLHDLLTGNRGYWEKRAQTGHERIPEEKRQAMNRVIDASFSLLQTVRKKRIELPKDYFARALSNHVENVAPKEKYRKRPFLHKKASDLKGDESLVTTALLHCLEGTPTAIMTQDRDIARIASSAMYKLNEKFKGVCETLYEFPLHIYCISEGVARSGYTTHTLRNQPVLSVS